MALDVYVMPLWHFKAGDVETAVQRLMGDRARVVTLLEILRPERIKGFLARRRAKRTVRQIIAEAEAQLNMRLTWHDEGATVYSEQAWWGFEALRAYAKWLDLQDHFPSFDDPPEENFYKHPAMTWQEEDRPFRFSHLIDHSCHNGYFIPCRFDRVVYVEPFQYFGRFTFYHSLGSTYTLADQLANLEPYIPAEDAPDISPTSRMLVRSGFDTLKKLSEASLEHQLPIVFWG